MARLREIVSSEAGVVLPVTTILLGLMGLMILTVFASAQQVSGSSNRDGASKRAFQAAQAGLEAAEERLNETSPGIAQCLADAPVSPVGGECPESSAEDLGRGVSFRYTVTPALPDADPCRVALPSQPAFVSGESVRCITSIGAANGVRRRVQARVSQATIFPVDGVFGKDRINQVNASKVYADLTGTTLGDLATNGSATRGNAAEQRHVLLGGTSATATGFTEAQIQRRPDPFPTPAARFEPVENANDNAKLSTLPASVWDPSTRSLTAPNTVVALETGNYHVCRLQTSQSGMLLVRPGHKVRIYVDSPERDSASAEPASSCPSTAGGAGFASGTVAFEQNSTVAPCAQLSGTSCTPGPASALLLYVYGRRAVSPDVAMLNSGSRVLGLYAPRSRIQLGNATEFRGSIVGAELDVVNAMNIYFDPTLRGITDGLYQRRNWSECRPQAPTPGDPESGC